MDFTFAVPDENLEPIYSATETGVLNEPGPVEEVNPYGVDPRRIEDLQRLREAIQHSQRELEPFRRQNRERIAQYAGDGYGENAEAIDTPFNVYNLALRIYKRRLFSGQMRVLVTASRPADRRGAYELSLAGDDVIREINLDETFDEVLQQALVSMGIVKIGIVPKYANEAQGILHDADQPFVDPILLEDFVYDTGAKRWEEIDFAGHRVRVPLASIMGNPEYDQEAAQELVPNQSRNGKEDLADGLDDNTVQQLGTGPNTFKDELREYVTIWEVWLPKERLIVTMADNSAGPALKVVPWEGPESGPFDLLRFDTLPGNIMGISPGQHLLGLSKLLNRLIRKLGDQADRQKNLNLVTRAATQNGSAEEVRTAGDGDTIPVDDPKLWTNLRCGGIDQNNYAFFMGVMQLYSYLGGNIDVIGGLSSRADTLGQEKLLSDAGNGLLADMDSVVLNFLKKVLTKVCWYIYTDPVASREIVKRVDGTDLQTISQWTPEKRTIPWFRYRFECDPYSVHVRSPSERLASVMQMYQTIVVPLMQYMEQKNINFDLEGFWRVVVRYTGLNELSEMIKSGGAPITGEPSNSLTEGPTKGPVTKREYVRRNVGSGAAGANAPPGMEALAMMSGGNGPTQGAA